MKRKKIGAIFASVIATIGLTAVGGNAASAATWSSSCTATKWSYDYVTLYIASTNVTGTLKGYFSAANTVVIEYITYNMGSPTIQYLEPHQIGPIPWHGGTGSSNNLEIKFVIPGSTSMGTRISGDNLAWSGVYNFVNFTTKAGTVVSVKAVPDLTNAPDPTCTMTFNVG
jgi:hypothetical protein